MAKYYLLNSRFYFPVLFILFGLQNNSQAAHKLTGGKLSLSARLDTVSGIVLDNNGKPIANVLVTNLDEKTTLTTDKAGKFSFSVKGQRLLFQHPDFYDKYLNWSGKPLIVQLDARYLPPKDINHINLKDTVLTEEQSVETLHGRILKKDLLESIGTVTTNQLTSTPVSQFMQALPGRIAGLNIGFSSGGPGLDGSGINFDVRQAQNNIILIDGVQRSYLSIDPDQIESVSVLKDALSTVLYGMRSSSGIISIITKKGNRGAPRISFTAQGGIERPTALPKPLNAAQYAMLYNEAKQNDAPIGTTLTPVYSSADITAYQNGSDPYLHPNVDWYNTALNPTAGINRYNFNVQGSGSNFRYFVDVDNLKETGLNKKNDQINTYNTQAQLDRYIVRSNLGVDLTKTTIMQLNLFGRIARNNEPGGRTSTLFSSLASTPNNAYPIFNPNGSLGGSSNYGQNANIYGQLYQRGYFFTDSRDMSVDLSLTQKLDELLPGLFAKVQGSYNNSTQYTTDRSKNFASYQYTITNTYTQVGSIGTQNNNGAAQARNRVTYLEGDLGYNQTFGKNNIGVLLVADQQNTLQYNTGNLPEIYSDLAARLNYNWDNKYLIEAAGSYANYNWFAPQKRWAPFWAAGLGWNLHNEHFIKDNFTFINTLKLRASYGLTGAVGSKSGYFSYIQTYWTPATNANNDDGYFFGTTGVGVVRSTGQSSLATIVGPEKARKLNLGADIAVLDNKLSFSGEYFKNNFYDLLGTPGVTTNILGIAFPVQNLYKYNYWGSDFSITYQGKVHNFNYFVNANLSWIQSRIIYNAEPAQPNAYQLTTGHKVGILTGYTAIGLFQSYAEINDPNTAVPTSTPRSSLRPGDIRYLDRNGDGKIDNNDTGPIGTEKPYIYYGTTVGFNYAGFDMSVLVQGVLNRQSALGGPTGQSGDFYNGFGNGGAANAYQSNLNRWTPQTASTATQPRLWLGSNINNQLVSTYWLRNTSFIRLKNVEVGYTLPAALTRKIGVPSIRVFTNGFNLLTWSPISKYRDDVDPESLGAVYPIMRVINFGINAKF